MFLISSVYTVFVVWDTSNTEVPTGNSNPLHLARPVAFVVAGDEKERLRQISTDPRVWTRDLRGVCFFLLRKHPSNPCSASQEPNCHSSCFFFPYTSLSLGLQLWGLKLRLLWPIRPPVERPATMTGPDPWQQGDPWQGQGQGPPAGWADQMGGVGWLFYSYRTVSLIMFNFFFFLFVPSCHSFVSFLLVIIFSSCFVLLEFLCALCFVSLVILYRLHIVGSFFC